MIRCLGYFLDVMQDQILGSFEFPQEYDVVDCEKNYKNTSILWLLENII